MQADVIVCLGKRIDFTLNFGSPATFDQSCKWIVVEADVNERTRAHLNLGTQLAACFAADPRDIIDDLIVAAIGNMGRYEWRTEVANLITTRDYSEKDQVNSGKITPAQLCAAVQRQLERASKSILICDGGEFGQWAQSAIQADRRVINGISGAIGGGYVMALEQSRQTLGH